jgi:hypothetical protein
LPGAGPSKGTARGKSQFCSPVRFAVKTRTAVWCGGASTVRARGQQKARAPASDNHETLILEQNYWFRMRNLGVQKWLTAG